MGRNKADGSVRSQSPENRLARPTGKAEDTGRYVVACCLVIVTGRVLSHVSSKEKQGRIGAG